MYNHVYFKNLHLLTCAVSHFQEHKNYNRNYNKILESDRSSAALITALIGQLHTSCTCNWTVVHAMPELLDSMRHQAHASCTLMGSLSQHLA